MVASDDTEGSALRHSAFIDNCAWDVFFDAQVDLRLELPAEAYDLWITREAQFEIAPLSTRRPDLKAYIDTSILESGVRVHSYFGFYQDEHGPDDQRVGGFDVGWWISQLEMDFIARHRAKVGSTKKTNTRLFKNEADLSLAARSLHSIVLTMDDDHGPMREAQKEGGRIVLLNDFPTSGLSLRDYIEARI